MTLLTPSGIKTEGIGMTPNSMATGRAVAPIEHYLPLHHTSNMLALPSWRFLVSIVALKHGVMQREILGTGRTRRVVRARHEAIALVYRHTQASMPAVGRCFGKDHSSVHHALRKFGATGKLVDRPVAPPRRVSEAKSEKLRAIAFARPRVNGKFVRYQEVNHA